MCAMIGAQQPSRGISVGRLALTWIFSHADVWYLLMKCASYVGKRHAASTQNTMSILENLLMLEEDYDDHNFNREDLDNSDIHIVHNGKYIYIYKYQSSPQLYVFIYNLL